MKGMILGVCAMLALSLTGCMTPEQWAYVKNPANTLQVQSQVKVSNCIGRTLKDCLDRFFDTFSISAFNNIVEQIHHNDAVDVNGEPVVSEKSIDFIGYIYGLDKSRSSVATIYYSGQQRIVTRVSVSLLTDPTLASTEDDYRKTGLFEALSIMLGSNCPSLDRMQTYKFFQNDVKPRIEYGEKQIEVSMNGASEDRAGDAKNVPLCGFKFSYSNAFGNDTEYVTLENPHGAYAISTVSVEK